MTSSFRVVAVLAVLVTSLHPAIVTASVSNVTCPSECRCGLVSGAPSADCSGRQIADLASLVTRLHPATQVLDLRFNELTVVAGDAFASLANLSVVLLDDNHIERVEPHAFRGLNAVRLLSLTGNRLTTVGENVFSGLAGRKDVCVDSQSLAGTAPGDSSEASRGPCVIDLSRNDIRHIQQHAFAWIKYLDVVLGHGRLPLTVDAYAFYGARWMRRVVVENVPTLTLRPRIFTNTESVDRVEIRDTRMTSLEQFVFEGLKDVGSIVLDRIDVSSIQSFAFSGIHFRRQDPVQSSARRPRKTDRPGDSRLTVADSPNVLLDTESGRKAARHAKRKARYAHSGGLLNVSSCHVGTLSTDAFRDANLAHILFSRTDVDHLEKSAFRGVSGLQTLRLVNCRLGKSIGAETFSSLRGLRRLHLTGLVDTRVVDPFAFRGVTDVDELLIQFRYSNVTLRTEAFAHVSDVETLELRGAKTGSGNKQATSLTIDVGAFRNLVGVERLRVVDFRLPTVRRHSFSGLSRVETLTISHCSVVTVEREAFGDVAGHVGAIGLLDLGIGNQLHCDCGGSTSGAAGLQRELERRFSDYRAVCRVEGDSTGDVSYVDVRQMASSVCVSEASSLRTVHSTSVLFAVVTAFIVGLAVHR